jgi:hypothetical protein
MNCSRQSVMCTLTCYFAGATGRIRPRDPLLRSHVKSVARRRLASLCRLSSSGYCRWPSEGVAQRLPALAPRLAPRNLLAFAKVRLDENNIDDTILRRSSSEPTRSPSNAVSPAITDIARRADVREWPFAPLLRLG